MTYKSKKDPTVTAVLDFKNPKFKTTQLIYVTGPNKGKSFSISDSTLKMWWEEVVEEDKPGVLSNLDYDKINTPYPEPKEKKYIPKPQSVIDYENNKIRKQQRYVCSFEKPANYDEFADLLVKHGVKMKGVNKEYISLPDNSKIKNRASGIALLASQNIGEMFIKEGYECKACPEKGTPFRFDFNTQEDFNKMLEVLSNVSY